jgi:hypothetical protein
LLLAVVGCADESDTDETWTFELQRLDSSGPLPPCGHVEYGFVLDVLRDDAGKLLGVYAPDHDPFDIYKVTTEWDGTIELEAKKGFPGEGGEQWLVHVEPTGETDRYAGTVTQSFGTTEETCRSVYLASMESSTR